MSAVMFVCIELTRVVRQVQENGGSQHAQPSTSTKSRQQINTHTNKPKNTHTHTTTNQRTHTHKPKNTHTHTHTHTQSIAKGRACTHTHKSHQHIHARTTKQIHTRNFAVTGESMTVSWLTGLLGLKQLDKHKRDSKCNVG
jgi:hypothetical protein